MSGSIYDIDFSSEWVFKTSRSGGKGGQHVNKVSTKVELNFEVARSAFLTDEQKVRIAYKLSNRINKDGFLQVVSESERTQLKNKQQAIARFYELLEDALKVPKKRKPTKMPRSVKEKRLKDKKLKGEKKESRRKPDW